MGLTVHFQLTASAGVNEAGAERIVAALYRTALNFYGEGVVDGVLPVTSDAKMLRQYAGDWLVFPVPGRQNACASIEILPMAGFIFRVSVGAGCEPLCLGLCRYPATARFRGNELPIKKGAGWRLAGFSKTQFASLHGWEHFRRCHCAVVNLLAACRRPDLRVKISDEGEYWPRRSLTNLGQNLREMNGLVAAAAGALKDAGDAADGRGGIQSPIFAHKHFERLEAEGVERVAPMIRKLRRLRQRP